MLADAVLHGRVPKGSRAVIDLDPATGQPACWAARRPSDPHEVMHELSGLGLPARGSANDTSAAVPALGGGFPGGYDGGYDGDGAAASEGEGAAEVLVLASGGFEDEE